MKIIPIFYALLFLALAIKPAVARPSGRRPYAQGGDLKVAPRLLAYTADVAASRLTWTGHAAAGTYAPTGTIQLKRATLETAPDGKTLRAARVVVAMPTLTGENADLAAHLRNADFFDVEKYPTATFELTAVRGDSATGQLTVKGVTKPVTLPVSLTSTPTGLRLRGTATVDRTRFGVTYNSPSFFSGLGDYAIRNDFQVAFDVVLRPAAR